MTKIYSNVQDTIPRSLIHLSLLIRRRRRLRCFDFVKLYLRMHVYEYIHSKAFASSPFSRPFFFSRQEKRWSLSRSSLAHAAPIQEPITYHEREREWREEERRLLFFGGIEFVPSCLPCLCFAASKEGIDVFWKKRGEERERERSLAGKGFMLLPALKRKKKGGIQFGSVLVQWSANGRPFGTIGEKEEEVHAWLDGAFFLGGGGGHLQYLLGYTT